MCNPWKNISFKKTIADCDANFINSLSAKTKSRLELRTLPEPYHGNPDANVYVLNGNPRASEEDLNFVGNAIYEKEVQDELAHENTEFLWLRTPETIVDRNGNPYPGYKYWKDRTKELRIGEGTPNLFCVELFPYHTLNVKDFGAIKDLQNLPSNQYTDSLILKAIETGKYIVLMRCARLWFERIPELKSYDKLATLNSVQNVCLSKNNICLPVDISWDKFLKSL